jgi:hypothetical protein
MPDRSLENKITRRTALTGGAAATLGAILHLNGTETLLAAAMPQTGQGTFPKEYRYGHVVQEYYVQRLRDISRRRQQARAAIRTPAQVMKLRAEVRRKLLACFGPWPERHS